MAERRGLECRQLSRGRGGAEHELLGQEQAEQPRAAHQVGGGWRGECGARGRQREGAGRAGLGSPFMVEHRCVVDAVQGRQGEARVVRAFPCGHVYYAGAREQGWARGGEPCLLEVGDGLAVLWGGVGGAGVH